MLTPFRSHLSLQHVSGVQREYLFEAPSATSCKRGDEVTDNFSREVSLADIANAAGCFENAIVRIFEHYREIHPQAAFERLRSFERK